MTKAELVSDLAERMPDHAKKAIGEIVNMVFYVIGCEEKVTINGFGVFRYKERVARVGRNPKTGESIDIPARRVLVFNASDKQVVVRD